MAAKYLQRHLSERVAVCVLKTKSALIPVIKRAEDVSRFTRTFVEPGKATITRVKRGEAETDMEYDPIG